MKALKVFELIAKLWCHLEMRRRAQFGLLLLLMIVSALSEAISIGALIPFLAALTSPKNLSGMGVFNFTGNLNSDNLILIATIVFSAAALLAGGIRATLLWVSTKLAFMVGAELSYKVYLKTLFQPYIEHIQKNSSETIDAVTGKSNALIFNVILPALNLLASLVMMIIIFGALVWINPLVAFSSMVGFGSIYFVLILIAKDRLHTNSKLIAINASKVIKALQEGIGGIRDVLIDGSQSIYAEIYKTENIPLRKAQAANIFISQSPRYLVESLGIILIAFIAYALTANSKGINSAIPILGAMALGAQRLLPVLQTAYASWTSVISSQASLEDTLQILDIKIPSKQLLKNAKPIEFNDEIALKDIYFKYDQSSEWVLNGLNLTIKKGERIGIIGKSGSGKSTLVDMLMGLLTPDQGVILVDGVAINLSNLSSWQSHIAHVPQMIFLADGPLFENIAFGLPSNQIDHDRVSESACKAELCDLIESIPGKYNANVGERGVRLSGGQRQRVGLARALYKNADIIIFDEATSALDDETESAVMKSIFGIEDTITMIIIAHRISTLRGCSNIYEIDSGICHNLGGYEEMILNNSKTGI